MLKICSKCLEEKSIEDFHKKKDCKDGHASLCKTCSIAYQKILRGTIETSFDDFNKKYIENKNEYINKESKICILCGVEKNKNQFHKKSSSKDGLHKQCKTCRMNEINQYRISRIKSYSERMKSIALKEKTCAKCNVNKSLSDFGILKSSADGYSSYCSDCGRKAKKESQAKNPWKKAYATAKRRAAILKRTPKYADLEAIKQIYKNKPEGYEVDHIIPLQGELISGLHVPENLQYLPKRENWSKNHFIDLEILNKQYIPNYIRKIQSQMVLETHDHLPETQPKQNTI